MTRNFLVLTLVVGSIERPVNPKFKSALVPNEVVGAEIIHSCRQASLPSRSHFYEYAMHASIETFTKRHVWTFVVLGSF
jgi:hypothetical protein